MALIWSYVEVKVLTHMLGPIFTNVFSVCRRKEPIWWANPLSWTPGAKSDHWSWVCTNFLILSLLFFLLLPNYYYFFKWLCFSRQTNRRFWTRSCRTWLNCSAPAGQPCLIWGNPKPRPPRTRSVVFLQLSFYWTQPKVIHQPHKRRITVRNWSSF